MAYRVKEDICLKCGYCQEVCPANAIYEKKDCYQIDGGACFDCGYCSEKCCCEAIESV